MDGTVIKQIMLAEKTDQREIARMIGCTQGNVSSMLRRDMKLSRVVEVLGIMGYEMIARKGDREYRF